MAGAFNWWLLMATCLPIWIGGLLQAVWGFIRRPTKFLALTDRSSLHFQDPFQGIEHQHLEVNGVRLHVARAGQPAVPGSKRLMLFVHGFPELWYSWRHQMEAFKGEYEVASVDLRGYGDSEKPKGRKAYRHDIIVDDLLALIKQLGHETCVLVGHDWGGVIAWHLAIWHPEVVQKLVVMTAPHPVLFHKNMDAEQKKRSQYMKLFQAPVLSELLLTSGDLGFLTSIFQTSPTMAPKRLGTFTDEDVERYKQAFAQPGAMTAALNYYRAAFDAATWNRVTTKPRRREKLPVPTLLLWADSDAALGPQLIKGIEDFVEDVDVNILENCSHWIQQDKPGEVNQLMRDFLTSSK